MDEKAISLGQAYSQLGQVYAYLKREEAESYFMKALSIFQEGTDDYYRTLSYLLHYYIDAENNAIMRYGRQNTLADLVRLRIN